MTNNKFAETIFSLKKISFSSHAADGAVIFENEEPVEDAPEQPQSRKHSSFFNVFLLLLVTGVLIGFISFAVITHTRLQRQEEELRNIQTLVKSADDSSVESLRKTVETLEHNFNNQNRDNSVWAGNITAEIDQLKQDSDSRFTTLIRESQLTLCSENKKIISVPVSGVYKLEISLLVTGHVDSGYDLAHVVVNDVSVSGGVIRVTEQEASTKTQCSKKSKIDCHSIKHAMVTRLKEEDEVKLNIVKYKRAIETKICAKISDIDLAPGVDSMIVSH